MNPIKPIYVAVAPDELHALNKVLETLNTKFAELGADLKGKTTLDRLFELAQSGLEMEELEKSVLEDYGPKKEPKETPAPKRKFDKCIYLIHFTDEESRVRHIRELMDKLDGEGWKSFVEWNERQINNPKYVFLFCGKNGFYELNNHDCDFEENGFPLYHWCGADPTKHRPKVNVGDRVIATTAIINREASYPIGYAWNTNRVDNVSEPVLPNGLVIRTKHGYRLATKYDINDADLAIMLVTLIACIAIALTVWGVFELLEYFCQ